MNGICEIVKLYMKYYVVKDITGILKIWNKIALHFLSVYNHVKLVLPPKSDIHLFHIL